ncbi:SGNH/GDSL hydrolase family protein [Aspergillus affinis]|uniref:SGNH/GDSL hydrolase family protein n=1 Tax=Aspergillus affinis TaxID=1070780 RepID=UPI0022FECF0A|nr:uncharacterized protein KD926_000403 [Aspergillus affinis]KAI9044492.1 hypothetical protein KD926_000403 [Aspergillus affinis]
MSSTGSMHLFSTLLFLLIHAFQVSSIILENGQPRLDPYPGQALNISLDESWKSYGPEASEIAYKGRWDSKYVSWWSIPGLKFGFTGDKLALSFGAQTSPGVLVAYRIGGLDWSFSNVTANATYQFVGPGTKFNHIHANSTKAFELRDVGDRATASYGTHPEKWNFNAHRPADLVVINLGTNDHRDPNNLPGETFATSYIDLIEAVHKTWPKAQVVLMSLWGNFTTTTPTTPGENEYKSDLQSEYDYAYTYIQHPTYVSEIKAVYEHFHGKGDDYVHYFDTTGILQHNDLAPPDHPTDVGHLKISSHLMRWTKIMLGWELGAKGPEVQHDTEYWNNEDRYK